MSRQLSLVEIRSVGKRRYRVAFDGGNERVEFEMWVEGDEIPVLHYEDGFDEFVHFNTGSLGPIFDAVMRFHHARQVPFPPPEVPGAILPNKYSTQ